MKKEKEEFLKILYKKVDDLPRIRLLENSLKAKQQLVGGRIEIIPYKDALLVCNDEGKLLNKPINLVFDYDCIAGDCFIVGDDYENADFKSLTDEQIADFMEDLKKRNVRHSYKQIRFPDDDKDIKYITSR